MTVADDYQRARRALVQARGIEGAEGLVCELFEAFGDNAYGRLMSATREAEALVAAHGADAPDKGGSTS